MQKVGTMAKLNRFLPSTHGLEYVNSWPHVPDRKVALGPGHPEIDLLDAANGLCGGMVFAVRDLFEAGLPRPPARQNPPPDSPAFGYIVERLFDSFGGLLGIGRYLLWMNLPRDDSLIVHGLSWLTINGSMPVIRSAIDEGHPCPLGLVCIQSLNPVDLGQNHQVLVWGYEDGPTTTTLHLYDPNHPNRDDVTITFDPTHPAQTTDFLYSTGEHTVFGFFVSDYSPCDPKTLLEDSG
jgi:hypothetical protein